METNYRTYAAGIQNTLNMIFDCDSVDNITGVLDSGAIYDSPYYSIAFGLATFYNSNSDTFKRLSIKDYLERYHQSIGEDIEQIGKMKIEKMIKEFNELVKLLKA